MIHGTRKSIAAGCGCNLCTLVKAQMKGHRPEALSVPARPVRDHLDALVAEGWRVTDLAKALGYHENTLYGIRSGRWQFTSRYIAEDVLSVPLKEVAA